MAPNKLKPPFLSIVCDGLLHHASPLIDVIELPLVLFISLMRVLMNQTPLSNVSDGPLPSANPFLMLILFLVLFIFFVMN